MLQLYVLVGIFSSLLLRIAVLCTGKRSGLLTSLPVIQRELTALSWNESKLLNLSSIQLKKESKTYMHECIFAFMLSNA